MKINFTKKEYRYLVDLITIGEWVINSHRTQAEDEPKHYNELIQKIYSYTKEMDCEDIIAYEKGLNGYHPTNEYDMNGKHLEYIDQFEADTMWQELIFSLSKRDIARQHDTQTLSKLSDEERIKIRCEAEAVWAKEFEEHGLDRIAVGAVEVVPES